MKLLTVSLLCLLALAGCKKEHTTVYQSQGVLLGPDMGYCITCGGQKVQIKGDTSKNAPPYYHTYSNFQALGLPANLQFPANVSLNWHFETNGSNWIDITAIKLD
jgi:hypothetical protein